MVLNDCKRIISEFRESRGQTNEPPKSNVNDRKAKRNPYYESFLRKYQNLDKYLGSLTSQDLVYYFAEVAKENGFKYAIFNIKKDASIMKKVLSNYDTSEVCAMIEFLYTSEQDYLRKDTLTPNILLTNWVNTVYADTKLWVNDEYSPSGSSSKKKPSHEWDSSEVSSDGDKSKIGVTL